MRVVAQMFLGSRTGAFSARRWMGTERGAILKKLIADFRDKLSDKANIKPLLDNSLKQVQSLPIPEQELFFKYLLMNASRKKLDIEHLVELKNQTQLKIMPHLLIEIDLLELMGIKDPVKKEKLFEESFGRLNLIDSKLTKNHQTGMFNLAFGDYSMRTNQMDRAVKCFEQAIACFEENIPLHKQELEKLLKNPPKENSDKRIIQHFQIHLNGLKEMLKGYIEKIGMSCTDLFVIHYDLKNFDKCQQYLRKGISTFEHFPGVANFSAVYFQLEKMLLELRMKLKKEDPAVLVKGYEELYNKAKEALETAPTDSHLYTLAVCMMTAARNKQILLGKPLEAEEEVAKAVDQLTGIIGDEKSKLLQIKMKQAEKLFQEGAHTHRAKTAKQPPK